MAKRLRVASKFSVSRAREARVRSTQEKSVTAYDSGCRFWLLRATATSGLQSHDYTDQVDEAFAFCLTRSMHDIYDVLYLMLCYNYVGVLSYCLQVGMCVCVCARAVKSACVCASGWPGARAWVGAWVGGMGGRVSR